MSPLAPLTPVTLTGDRVRLVPLQPSLRDEIWRAAQADEIWAYLPLRLQTQEAVTRWLEDALAARAAGQELPFAIVDQHLGRVVGSTRFLDISLPHRGVEIGWTWLAPDVWRTRVNTECKLLLLTHAFETLDLIRVSLKTDARNLRSQQAIERLGAVREGIWRNHRILPDGFIRDTVYYSILPAEWPAVKRRLESFLARDAERQDT